MSNGGNQTYKVFISSTYIDLKDYRAVAIDVVERYECLPLAMERFMAQPKEPEDACREKIEECDIFVGIYAHRYGFITERQNVSITQQEYELAKKLGKDVLCFIVKDEFPWNPKLCETEKSEELKAFLDIVKKEKVVCFFETTSDFDGKVASSLGKLLRKKSRTEEGDKERVGSGGDITGIDELYLAIACRDSNLSAAVVVHDETTWAWKLFPTILEWTLSGVPVIVFLSPSHGDDKQVAQERYRRNLLENLGVRVIAQRALPFKGFILDAQDEANLEILRLAEGSSGYEPFALRHEAKDDPAVVKALLSNVPAGWKGTDVEFCPSIAKYPDEDVVGMLQEGVLQYKRHGVTVEPASVETRVLSVISRYTREYKYRQVERLAERYRKAGVVPFQALSILLRDGSHSIVTPPVVEDTPDGLIVIEGNTRATYCLRNGVDKFFCLLVKGVSEPPPGDPYPLTEVEIVGRTLTPDKRIKKFDYRRFRHIERAIHPY